MKKILVLLALFYLATNTGQAKTYTGVDENNKTCFLKINNLQKNTYSGKTEAIIQTNYTEEKFLAFSRGNSKLSYDLMTNEVVVTLNNNQQPLSFRYIEKDYSLLSGLTLKKDVTCHLH